MKKVFLTAVLATLFLTTFGQDTTSKTKIYRNEFGIDATSFFKQFLNFNQTQFSNFYTPTYYLTYRRHLKCGNIRSAIGLEFSSQDIPASQAIDSNQYHRNSYSIDARIGWEFFNNLNKRWQVYYGIDFRPTYSYIKDDVPYWNGGYANGIETKSQIYGFAPVLGFRFKITDRLSLTTEANFSVNFESTKTRKYYIPTTSAYAPIPDMVTPMIKKIYSNFSQPIFIILTFDI